jgi:hypothetical protein
MSELCWVIEPVESSYFHSAFICAKDEAAALHLAERSGSFEDDGDLRATRYPKGDGGFTNQQLIEDGQMSMRCDGCGDSVHADTAHNTCCTECEEADVCNECPHMAPVYDGTLVFCSNLCRTEHVQPPREILPPEVVTYIEIGEDF